MTKELEVGGLSRRQFGAAAAAALAGGLVPATAQAATFVPNETLISSAIDLIDMEYSSERKQYARVDNSAQLWVGDIDPDTGDYVDPTGRQYLVDTNTMNTGDLFWVYTGAEWMQTADGREAVVYTKFVPGKRHQANNARIGYAEPNADGTWTAGVLPPGDRARFDIYGIEELGADKRPALFYLDAQKNKVWRNFDDPTERIIPGTTTNGAHAIRFVRGARAVVYRSKVNDVWQVFRYDLDTLAVQQLTFENDEKSLCWMWAAPDFGGDFVLMVLAKTREIRFYRNLPDAQGNLKWTQFYKVSGARGSTIQSLEPFTWNGRSYFFMDLELPNFDFPSEIWFGNLDLANPIWRCVSPATPVNVRTDPEFFITNNGPIIYYLQFVPGAPKQDGAIGMFRCNPLLTA